MSEQRGFFGRLLEGWLVIAARFGDDRNHHLKVACHGIGHASGLAPGLAILLQWQ